jgi:hypothetical protein
MQHTVSLEKQNQLDEKRKLIAHIEFKLMYGGVVEINGMYYGKKPTKSDLMSETHKLLEITKPIVQHPSTNTHQRVF